MKRKTCTKHFSIYSAGPSHLDRRHGLDRDRRERPPIPSMDRYSVTHPQFVVWLCHFHCRQFSLRFSVPQQTGPSHSRSSELHVDTRSESGRGAGSSMNSGNRDRISPHYHGNGNNPHHPNGNNGNHQSASPPSYENGIKSDSPSRKRRRVSSRMPSQSPPSSWEQRVSPRNQQNQQHTGPPQHSPLLRRRLRDAQTRPWDPPMPSLFQQTSTQHNQQQTQSAQQPPLGQQQAPALMVEMNQVPVSLPLRNEPIWTYPAGPHISFSSLCTNHPPPAQHLQQCQVHSVYPQPFAQNCNIGNHYGSFSSPPAQLPPMQAQPHQPSHYQHSHMQQVNEHVDRRHLRASPNQRFNVPLQRQEGISIDGMDHHHGPAQASIHVSPLAAAAAAAHIHSSSQMTQVSPAQPIFISTAENRQAHLDLIHRQARRPMTTQRRNYARVHWPAPPPHHSHHHHPMNAHRIHQQHNNHHHQPMSHQPQLPIQTGIINSGILLNFL